MVSLDQQRNWRKETLREHRTRRLVVRPAPLVVWVGMAAAQIILKVGVSLAHIVPESNLIRERVAAERAREVACHFGHRKDMVEQPVPLIAARSRRVGNQ